MSDEEVMPGSLAWVPDRAGRWLTDGRFGLGVRTWRALLAVVAVGLLARLVALGYRPMHFDEARVGYWALRYAETGHFEYRYIIHGPLLQHVGRWLFPLLGANDFVARLPVALVGGLLPLSAVLFRDHLRESELLGMAVLLAGNPILLYYSRFMRSDLLVATFMFVALGMLVRLHATSDPRYLHGATAFVALGFASKENAVVYLLAWAGAAALVVDAGLYRPRNGETGVGRLVGGAKRLVADRSRAVGLAKRWGGHGLLTLLLFLGLTLFFFAPRAGDAGGVGLWKALTAPAMVPDLLWATTWDIARGMGYWFGGSIETRCRAESWLVGYGCFLKRYLISMLRFGWPLVLLAAAGFLRERYAAARSRNLVMFAGYWGVASVVGYPVGMDIWAVWPIAHALVPLAVPAAVAFGYLLRAASDLPARLRGAGDGRLRRAVVPALVVVLLVGYSSAAAVEASYLDARERDEETDMVQYAQPSGDMRPGLRAMRSALADSERPTVVYFGGRYYLEDESVMDAPPVPWDETGGWFDRLPLPWYTEAADATVASVRSWERFEDHLAASPTVLVVPEARADDVAETADGYRRYGPYDLRAHLDGPSSTTSVVIFVRTQS